MTTIAHKDLGKYVGIDADAVFQHVSPQVMFALPTAHVLNTQGSGTCRWPGKVTDHSFSAKFFTNERSMAFNGFDGTNARLPVADDCILLEILPSCTCILDVCVTASAGGETALWDDADGDGEFVTGFAGGVAETENVGLQPCAVPVGDAAAAFPPVEIWLGYLNGPCTEVGDISSFARVMLLDANGDLNPEIALLNDTGRIDEAFVIYAKLLGDAPANSFMQVHGVLEKAGRY